MITQQYEHHLDLRQDKLCPFKFKTCTDVYNSVCNWHHNIELLLVTGGEGRIQYGSDDFSIKEHDMITVNSEVLHRIYSASGISFTYALIDESFCIQNGLETRSRCFERIFTSESLENALLNSHRIYDEYKKTQNPINTARLRCATLNLIIELCTHHTSEPQTSASSHSLSEKYVKKALEYIGEHYSEPISLEDVARICGITKYHLVREFKKHTGQTVFVYINILRCKKAELCMLRGMTVTEAARESGFENPSYFSRTYKKLMGRSPSSEKENR